MNPWHRLVMVFGVLVLTAGCTAPITAEQQPTTVPTVAGSDPSAVGDPTSAPPPSTVATSPPAAVPAAPAELRLDPTIIILDASGSMAVEDAPGPRIVAAKNAVLTLIDGLPDEAPVGLIVYGTGTDSSDGAKPLGCQDIKSLVGLGPVDKAAFAAAVGGVTASGYTPIGAALRTAAAELPSTGPRNIILVSDGEDTCAPPDPCEVAKEINTAGTGLAVHTVGFRVNDTVRGQLSCIAQAGGGSYVDAANAVQLQARLRTAVDPNAAVNTLTSTGFSVMQIGMTATQAHTADPSVSPAATGTVTIIWLDCALTFTDGILVGIAPQHPIPIWDGLAIGDDVSRAAELYGPSTAVTENGHTHAIFAANQDAAVGYDITYTPTTAGQLSGTITTITMCRCKPPEPAQDTSGSDPGTAKVTKTEIQHIKPVDDDGNLLSGYTLGSPAAESTPSGVDNVGPSGFGGSAYNISTGSVTGGSLHGCWPTATPRSVVCLFSPDDTKVIPMIVSENLAARAPVSDLSADVRPWQLLLDDGRKCRARTQGSMTLRLTYLCSEPDDAADREETGTVSQVDRSADVWTIQQVDANSMADIPDRDNPPTRTATVVTAWFAG